PGGGAQMGERLAGAPGTDCPPVCRPGAASKLLGLGPIFDPRATSSRSRPAAASASASFAAAPEAAALGLLRTLSVVAWRLSARFWLAITRPVGTSSHTFRMLKRGHGGLSPPPCRPLKRGGPSAVGEPHENAPVCCRHGVAGYGQHSRVHEQCL